MRIYPDQQPPEIQRMLAVCRVRKFQKKAIIVQEGLPSKELFYIMSGSVVVEKTDENGQRLILAYLGPGEFFGELGLFTEDVHRSASVLARTECEMASIGYPEFTRLFRENPDLLLALSRQLARRLENTSSKLSNLAFLDVTGRIARALLELAEDSEAMTHPEGMLVKITREELGQLVNCSRELAGKVLYALQEQGLIHMEGRSIVIYRDE